MHYSKTFQLIFRYSIQLAVLFFLNWCLHVLMPVIVDTLMKGMSTWNAASILYCWYLQLSFLVVSFSLREQLSNKAIHWLRNVPFSLHKLFMIFAVLCMIWMLLHAIQLFFAAIDRITFVGIGELFLLIIQFVCLMGIAVPMVNHKCYRCLFCQNHLFSRDASRIANSAGKSNGIL
jgi:hypothetical protein